MESHDIGAAVHRRDGNFHFSVNSSTSNQCWVQYVNSIRRNYHLKKAEPGLMHVRTRSIVHSETMGYMRTLMSVRGWRPSNWFSNSIKVRWTSRVPAASESVTDLFFPEKLLFTVSRSVSSSETNTYRLNRFRR